MDKILVTGGAGFIGKQLVMKLIELKYDVTILDNFSNGPPTSMDKVSGNVNVISGDIRDREIVDKAVKGIDVIIHLAAAINVIESIEKPLLYHEVNATGTLNVLCSAKDYAKQMVFASSAAVYGNPIELPVLVTHPTDPLSPYAASKLSAEAYCKSFSNIYDMRCTILRFFNVYGPGQVSNAYSGVINKFINRLMNNEFPIINGDGKQTRDFIYVSDLVDAIIGIIGFESNRVFNIGTGRGISVNELAEKLMKIMRKEEFKPIHSNPNASEVENSWADISDTKNIFGFRPKTSLEEGLRRTVNSIQNTEYEKA
jgi:UDP-glucose 4-epimerase